MGNKPIHSGIPFFINYCLNPSGNMSKFYLTTPLYYVNDKPHIGHAYTTILGDVLTRYHRIMGEDVFFLTGTDEHGQKVQEAAAKRDVESKVHVDEYVTRFQKLWKKLHIEYADFIRTTERRHTDRVKELLTTLYEKGEIYPDEYEGLYSVSEERFVTEKEVEEGDFRQIKKLKEKNYFFRMSKYQDALIEHIGSHPEFIKPGSRRNEVLGFLKKPLNDLCISRPKSRLSWGIEIPFDHDYVTYVWFDALLNYITAIGWGADENKFNKWWPVNYHLIGKDILTTHAVYWPTMLMAAGISLPKTIFAHGWWMSDETKMSKSLGNVINPLELIDEYGVDSVRFFLMRDMVLGKFLAAWIFTGVALVLTCPIWFTVNYLGDPDNGVILASYIGSWLMAGAMLAVGSCISACTKNQVIAFILSVVVCFLMMVSGWEIVLGWWPDWVADWFIESVAALSFLTHFNAFAKGVLDLRDVLYFVIMMAGWLTATAIVIDIKKAN